MTIAESLLETWSHRGAVTTAEATHESVRKALEGLSQQREVAFEVYLQGSYRNNTNVRGDSDVDIVVQLHSAFKSDISRLSASDSSAWRGTYRDATYGWTEFRIDVLKALVTHFGQSEIEERKKCIKLVGDSGRLPADIVVAIQFRNYAKFSGTDGESFVEGMTFFIPSEIRWVVNYPKVHYENGVRKNSESATNGWFKPVVRIFKNARTLLEEKSAIPPDLAPSYFLESLVYNVPDSSFGGSYQLTLGKALLWLAETDLKPCVCQNEQGLLFGDSPEQWSVTKAKQLISALIQLWNQG